MRALSIRQPYAEQILGGTKRLGAAVIFSNGGFEPPEP
jgi:hypothetical protein